MSTTHVDEYWGAKEAATAHTERGAGPSPGPIRVALVGTGYIAGYHVAALRELAGVEVVGACDPHGGRLADFCGANGIPHGAASLGDLLDRCRADVAHILVPPPFHYDVALKALRAGLHVLLEKPMVLSSAEGEDLLAVARERGLRLAVNHNAVYHPLFRRLLADVAARKLGRVEHVVSVNNLPLGQLEGGDHDHWMFREPRNVLFEQAPHPLSQVCELLGEVRQAQTLVSGRQTLRTGAAFVGSWQASMTCERGTAQLFLSFGRPFPEAVLHVIGLDGSAQLDLLNNIYTLDRRTRRFAALDTFLRGGRRARQTAWGAVKGLVNYTASTLRLRRRTDPYYRSMAGSIAAFYDALKDGRTDPSTENGRLVTAALERVAAAADLPPAARPVRDARPTAGRDEARDGEVLVLGGTGFIGRHLVRALADAGHPVRLMARRPALVPAVPGGGLRVVAGDIRNPDDVSRAVQGCRSVIHLVAGAPEGWPEYERLYVGGTRNVAEACLRWKIPQLFFASSICAYYLGKPGVVVTEDTPLETRPATRCDYARAKIACEQLLGELHREKGLPVTVFRPGIVVGAGGPVEHLGVGHWPSPTHCVAWGREVTGGLPFVLADDVAAALALAVGKPGLEGRSFNLVGDVRLSAREYVDELSRETGRDVRLHRRSVLAWAAAELGVWVVKAVGRKANNSRMTYREVAYRTAASQFDCSQAKKMLGWRPVADREEFIEKGVRRALRGAEG